MSSPHGPQRREAPRSRASVGLSRWALRCTAAAALFGAGSCNAILGFDAGRVETSGPVAGSGGATGGGAGGTAGATGVGGTGDCAAGTEGWQCAPAVPSEWQGPTFLWLGDSSAAPSGCPGGFLLALTAYRDLSWEPASCGACACQLACELDDLRVFFAMGCPGAPPQVVPQVDGACAEVAANPMAVEADAPTTVCTPSGGIPYRPAPAWGGVGLLCQPDRTGSGCAAGLCVPTPDPPFAGQLCVWQGGEATCPAGYAAARYVGLYEGSLDGRGCSPCGCQQTQACAARLWSYGDPGCSYNPCTIVPASTCTQLACATGSVRPEITSPGSCQPVQAVPLGAVVPVGPVTVCCGEAG